MGLKKTTKIVPKKDGKLNVLFVGDSQTDYSTSYANLLLGNEVTGTRISKIGAAMSVITEYFKEGYVKGEFDIVSVMGGNNDATSKNFNKSFADIVKTVTADGGKVVIITCPSVKYVNKGNKSDGKPYWPYFAKSNKKTGADYYEYADDIAKWQKSLSDDNVIIVDAHNKLDDSKNFDSDGLHLSSNGQKELKKLWLEATKSVSNNNNNSNSINNATVSTSNPTQPVVSNTDVPVSTSTSDSDRYVEFTNKDYPNDIQTRCTFDVTKNAIYKSESGDSTIASQTYIISNPAPDSKLVEKIDGTKIELGDLTLVRKEDPFDPEIIRLLTPYSTERVDELDPEYIEEKFVGEDESYSVLVINDPIDSDSGSVIGTDSNGNEIISDDTITSDENYKEVDLESMFLYMTHNQGAYGASCHYKVATGQISKYPVGTLSKSKWVLNMVSNWPKDKSNKISQSEVSGLFDSNPKKLAIEFLKIWKNGYAKKTEAAYNLITSSGKNRTGTPYKDILAVFKKYSTTEMPWKRLVEFGYIENSFCTDTANEKQVNKKWQFNQYKTMFQIAYDYYGPKAGKNDVLSGIKTKYLYKDAYKLSYKRHWNDYDIDDTCRLVVPRIIKNFKSFKDSVKFDLNELKKIGL